MRGSEICLYLVYLWIACNCCRSMGGVGNVGARILVSICFVWQIFGIEQAHCRNGK